jgi:hypothetical protein
VTVEDINIGALYLDLPAFNLTLETVTQTNSTCQTPLPGDEVYTELIAMDGALVSVLSYELLDGDASGVIKSWTLWQPSILEQCFAFFPGLGFIGEVPSSPTARNLTTAAIETCSTGNDSTSTGTAAVGAALKALSPGDKAGVAIGVYRI